MYPNSKYFDTACITVIAKVGDRKKEVETCGSRTPMLISLICLFLAGSLIG